MAKPTAKPNKTESDILCAVLDGGDIAVVRVQGRGSFMNSVPFERFAKHLREMGQPRQFIVDLAECETLDSTFMGMLASVSQAQSRSNNGKLVVVNVNDHVRRLLKTLGLTCLLDIHESATRDAADALSRAELQPAEAGEVSRVEQILHTLEAHKTLVKADMENEIRFQSVIHYLEKSLENAEQGKDF